MDNSGIIKFDTVEKGLRSSRSLNTIQDVNTLNNARKVRKQAQIDVKALQNRIFLLEKEEEKARCRIEKTKKRAEEIILLREENYKRKKQFQKLAIKSNQGIAPEILQKRYVDKVIAKETRRRQKVEMKERKKHDAMKFREERKIQVENISRKKCEMKKEAKEKAAAVRKHKEDFAKRQQQERQKQRIKAQKDYHLRVEEEKRKAQEYEKKAQELEQKELEMIKRLQQTQSVQRKAYLKLEKAFQKCKT